MHIGVVFPQTEIGTDPAAIESYATTVEELGYHHILTYDHVIGANTASRPGWRPPYSHLDMFHEPFVLFGFLAGITQSIELVTGILILPQRQTVLVAKQAAALDVLTGGRVRLGVGIGWNPVEYEALGENFRNRGRRSEEQIEVLRKLWTGNPISYEGRWHKITDAGLHPLPVQRPIPIWLGGTNERVLERVGRLGDGWFPQFSPDAQCQAAIDKIYAYAKAAGRDPAAIGIEGRLPIGGRAAEAWVADVKAWKQLGATHLTVNTMKAGLATPAAHLEALRRFRDETKPHW
jgi:probable F420-dependent oxidoreductase